MKKISLLFLLGLGSLVLTGCQSMQVGFGVSQYDSSTGMSYSVGVTDGPYGQHGSVSVGYTSGRYFGRPYYYY